MLTLFDQKFFMTAIKSTPDAKYPGICPIKTAINSSEKNKSSDRKAKLNKQVKKMRMLAENIKNEIIE